MVIRIATPEDAAALTDLAHRAKAHWGYSAAWMGLWRTELTITPLYIARHRVLAGEEDGALVGTCALEDLGDHWALEHVWVTPGAQGRGIGQALVERALALVQESRPGLVTVKSDPNAVGFYRRLGATAAGVVAAPMPGAPGRQLPVLEFHVLAA